MKLQHTFPPSLLLPRRRSRTFLSSLCSFCKIEHILCKDVGVISVTTVYSNVMAVDEMSLKLL